MRADGIEIHDFFVFSRFTGILLTDSTDTSQTRTDNRPWRRTLR
jgi:hypothetical protein